MQHSTGFPCLHNRPFEQGWARHHIHGNGAGLQLPCQHKEVSMSLQSTCSRGANSWLTQIPDRPKRSSSAWQVYGQPQAGSGMTSGWHFARLHVSPHVVHSDGCIRTCRHEKPSDHCCKTGCIAAMLTIRVAKSGPHSGKRTATVLASPIATPAWIVHMLVDNCCMSSMATYVTS